MQYDVAATGRGPRDAGKERRGDGDVWAECGVACWVAVDGYLAGRVFGDVDTGWEGLGCVCWGD